MTPREALSTLPITSTRLARLLHVERSTVHRWRNGEMAISGPAAALIHALAAGRITEADLETEEQTS